MYTLILTTFYNYVVQVGLDPVEIILTEIQTAEGAISDICEAADNALSGFFMAALTIDPKMAKKLALSKFLFLE